MGGDGPVYFLLHVPKTGGQTVQVHLQEHLGEDALWMPPAAPAWRRALGLGDPQRPARPQAVRAVAGHHLRRSHERVFAGRPIRRAVLLREPLSFHLSLYNFRMMNRLRLNRAPTSFEAYLRAAPLDSMAHLILHRWLEIPWPVLALRSAAWKYARLNAALRDFWFVGDVGMCDALVAELARNLRIPRKARRRNTEKAWLGRVSWSPLRAEDLSDASVAHILGANPLDRALWESWKDAGLNVADVAPIPLLAREGPSFLVHELGRIGR
jgi:hypothetical protein